MLNRAALSFDAQRQALAQAAAQQTANGPDFSVMEKSLASAGGLLAAAMQPTVQAVPEMTKEEAMKLMGSLEGYGGNKPRNNEYSETNSRTNELLNNTNRNYVPGSDMGRMIVDTAKAMGADPLDLATAISYETAGTFDPTKSGPTTQWGQHRGLIQFGEPQAKQHGVDWNDPLNSQLGAGKAVQRYFESSGWKPGMSGLDLYSIINAGAPGRYSASDANNGGAPGSVRDKWENQMNDHRIKAAKLLGIM